MKFTLKSPIIITSLFSWCSLSRHRVQRNWSWFVIHGKVLNFHVWILCYHKPFHNKIRKKWVELSIDLWHLNNTKLSQHIINTKLCWLYSCFLYWFFLAICIVHNQVIYIANLKNFILEFSKNMIIPPLIWVFDFIG